VIKILQNQSNTNQLEHENVINISWGTWKLAPLIIKKKKMIYDPIALHPETLKMCSPT